MTILRQYFRLFSVGSISVYCQRHDGKWDCKPRSEDFKLGTSSQLRNVDPEDLNMLEEANGSQIWTE